MLHSRVPADGVGHFAVNEGSEPGVFPARIAGLMGEGRWIEFVPITFEVADALAYWRAEIPGKVKAFA
jgi:hypothetical protein